VGAFTGVDPSQEINMVGRAPPGEGRRPRLDERECMLRQEIVNGRRGRLAVGQQLRDLGVPPYWRCPIGPAKPRLAQLNVHVTC
jgi:hypothetical protein